MPQLPATAEAPHPLLRITSYAQLELRGRILAAAKQHFARFSHEDSTLVDIAHLAHLDVEDVEEHFGDIDEMLRAVQRGMDQSRAMRRLHKRPGRHEFAAKSTRTAEVRIEV